MDKRHHHDAYTTDFSEYGQQYHHPSGKRKPMDFRRMDNWEALSGILRDVPTFHCDTCGELHTQVAMKVLLTPIGVADQIVCSFCVSGNMPLAQRPRRKRKDAYAQVIRDTGSEFDAMLDDLIARWKARNDKTVANDGLVQSGAIKVGTPATRGIKVWYALMQLRDEGVF